MLKLVLFFLYSAPLSHHPSGDSCVIGIQQPLNDKELRYATDEQQVQKADLCGSSDVVAIDDEEQLVKHAGAELNVPLFAIDTNR